MKNHTESERWLLDQARANIVATSIASEPALEEVRGFTKSFWPFMEAYYSPLQPVFSFELARAARLQRQPLWMLRDGTIPLSWFFESLGPQAPAQSRLLVHEALGNLVPPPWRKRTKFYDVYAEKTYHSANPPKRLLLFGPVNSLITGLDDLDRILAEAKETLGRANLEEVILYCPVRHSEHVSAEEESFECQFYHRIFSVFGAKAKFRHWQSLEHGSFPDTALVELNGGWLYQDSSVLHLLLSRGAGLLRAPAKRRGERIPLSPFHGMEIFDASTESGFRAKENAGELLRFYSALHRKTNEPRNRVPWPKWFETYSRASRGRA